MKQKRQIKNIIRYILMFILIIDISYNLLQFKQNIIYEPIGKIKVGLGLNMDYILADFKQLEFDKRIKEVHELSFQRDKILLNLIIDFWLFLMLRYGKPYYLNKNG